MMIGTKLMNRVNKYNTILYYIFILLLHEKTNMQLLSQIRDMMN